MRLTIVSRCTYGHEIDWGPMIRGETVLPTRCDTCGSNIGLFAMTKPNRGANEDKVPEKTEPDKV